MRSLLLILFLFVQSLIIRAQTSDYTIKVLAKVGPDGVWLRWAPASATVWQLGNQYGHTIDRYTLNAHGDLDTMEPIRLNATPVKPFSEQALETLAKTTAEASIIQELIYETETGRTTETSENPVSLLKNHEDQQNRFGMALLVCDLFPTVAHAAGLFFKDTTAITGARYIYRISLAKADTKITVAPGVIVVDATVSKPLQPFNDVKATFGDKTVTLSWSTFTHTGTYTAYVIEKSPDGKIFKPITDLPYMPMSESADATEAHFVDSLEHNATLYHYRIRGITPFGEKGPPSNIVSGVGKVTLSGLLVLREINGNDRLKVTIRWEFPAEHETSIHGFAVERAPKAEGPYTTITKSLIGKKLRTSTFAAFTSSAYYRIKAVDTNGHETCQSYPYFHHVEDNTPPSIPAGLSGKVDKAGIVTLSWKKNPDSDLLGYRVFSSHHLQHEFVEITTSILSAPVYTDTVNIGVLNKKVYYTVIAVDNNFNTSAHTEPLVLYKPDVIPPAAPVFGKIEKKQQSIVLQWIKSASLDAAHYTLFRTRENDTIKTRVLHWRADKVVNSVEDEHVVQGQTYRYQLSVYDSAGNTNTAISKAIAFESGLRKAIDDMTATIERDKKVISVTWKYDETPRKCLLYRRKNNEPFTLYQALDGTTQKFTDNQVLVNNTYAYKIQLVLDKNVRTELSRELRVPF